MLNKTIENQLRDRPDQHTPSTEEILATTAIMIGGVAIGRALNDTNMTKHLLSSCHNATLSLLKLENP